jgi:hypothetical protein
MIAADSRDELGRTIGLARAMVVLLGAAVGLGQLVPLWVGREVLAELRSGEGDAPLPSGTTGT